MFECNVDLMSFVVFDLKVPDELYINVVCLVMSPICNVIGSNFNTCESGSEYGTVLVRYPLG